MSSETNRVDYYEFLQISPRADQETVHRVYRFLAARFHPDNPGSGDAERFATLSAAYETLSDPARRAEYDALRETEGPASPPISSVIDLMDSVAGELNRRLAVLAVLYFQRRSNPNLPEVSLAALEARMGFPREYLDFTTWYLRKKGYITKADNSDFTLTVAGVDFIEMQRVNIPVLNKLLTNGSDAMRGDAGQVPTEIEEGGPTRLIVLPDMTLIPDRRKSGRDRRSGTRDQRLNPGEDRRNHG